MGKTIIITEKPSVAQEYKKALKVTASEKTDGYVEGYSPVLSKNVQITWAVGHLITLGSVDEQRQQKVLPSSHKNDRWAKDKLPIVPTDWLYKPNDSTKKQFGIVKKLYTAKDVDCIYYAGDSGREGIYIQALIRNQIFGGKKPACDEKVVWIDSYTEESILNGIKTAKPYSAYQNMIDSGYERAISDWLIGMNLTQAFTLTSGGLIKVGRVMTPTLAMVAKRQDEIDNFEGENYYGFTADISSSFVPKWKADKQSRYYESPLLFNENGFKKKEDADALLNEFNEDKSLKVMDVSAVEKKEFAPLLFNLADLQAYCSKVFHISPAQTLSIAQSLYEKKLTTYPRTDSRYLTTAVKADIKAKLGKDVPPKYVDDSKVTDHYALMPTFLKGNLTGLEKSVYDAICNRFNAIFYPPYVYDSVKISYQHKNGEYFYVTDKKVKQLGYKELYGEKMPEGSNVYPSKGEVISVKSFEESVMTTTPPSAYTTGSMILAMEKSGKLIEDEQLREQLKTCGIGTSATRAGIIEKLKDTGYINIDKKQKITPTDIGKSIIPIIEKFDSQLISPEKTATMEQKLQDVADGKMSKDAYRKYIESYVKDTTAVVLSENKTNVDVKHTQSGSHKAGTYNCPCCGTALSYGRFGYYCDKGKGGCGFSFSNEIAGRKMKEDDLKMLISKGETKKCAFTSKAGKKFTAKLVLDKENHKTKFEFS